MPGYAAQLVAVVGNRGCGKTTLTNQLSTLIPGYKTRAALTEAPPPASKASVDETFAALMAALQHCARKDMGAIVDSTLDSELLLVRHECAPHHASMFTNGRGCHSGSEPTCCPFPFAPQVAQGSHLDRGRGDADRLHCGAAGPRPAAARRRLPRRVALVVRRPLRPSGGRPARARPRLPRDGIELHAQGQRRLPQEVGRVRLGQPGSRHDPVRGAAARLVEDARADPRRRRGAGYEGARLPRPRAARRRRASRSAHPSLAPRVQECWEEAEGSSKEQQKAAVLDGTVSPCPKQRVRTESPSSITAIAF
mgnify:CR=1 FL=1